MAYSYQGTEYDIDLHDSPLLIAAFQLAVKAHAGQFRKGSHKPYIDHIVMVYNLMEKLIQEPSGNDKTPKNFEHLYLAIALLHDSIEDYYRKGIALGKKSNPVSVLKRELYQKLENHYVWHSNKPVAKAESDLKVMVSAICSGVDDLSNDVVFYEGKRTWQADHVRELKYQLKLIKIVDQTASVIDDILYCDPTFYSPHEEELGSLSQIKKAIVFAMKGFDIARVLPEDNPFFRFYAQAYLRIKDIYDHAQIGFYTEIERIRREDYNNSESKIVEDLMCTLYSELPSYIVTPRGTRAIPEPVSHFYSNLGNPRKNPFVPLEKGLQRITINGAGQVVGYGIVVVPASQAMAGSQHKDSANQAAIKFREHLEEVRDVLLVTKKVAAKEQGVEEHRNNMHVRTIKVKPSMDLEQFLTIADEDRVIDADFLSRMGKVLKEYKDMNPVQGNAHQAREHDR
jgi:hypothetical protein